ncbi:hypothetical protein [Kitasatospora sp. NPDC096140]|uniref:hypothetical protein n=1 Tax=Kitasatospora sp. NPDC096140 TaxID=3155425 RepID=UPI00332BD896
MDATTLIARNDYRLFKQGRLAVIDTQKSNAVTFDGKLADHGTYRNIPEDFKLGIDAATFFGYSDYRLFRGDQLVVIDTENGNQISYQGAIAGHGTYRNIPEDFKRGIDATTLIGRNDYRLFKGDQLVVIDTENGNRVTYYGPIADHGTYSNIPADFRQGIDAATFFGYSDYRLFRGDQLVVIDTQNGNSLSYQGAIADHGTYQNLSSFWTS